MYRCDRCGEIFEEPATETYCYEDYCGVAALFEDRHYGTYDCCPYCGSEEIDDYFEEELDEIEE